MNKVQTIEWISEREAHVDPPMTARDCAYLMGLHPPRYPVPACLAMCEIREHMVVIYNADESLERIEEIWFGPAWAEWLG